ncbi:hypothetical protein SAY86_013549 [Trapa natans]|uniref:Tetratricopeptide repeat-like superfamily protein n=1 Tax=Trapa natans TaxID=22666 RepID=A0AAN7KSK6_TRANT|nr:hypothetical protein SAY86_013549 [Trapa natans]
MGAGVASSPSRLSFSVVLEATPASAAFSSSPWARRLNISRATPLTPLLLSSSRGFPVPKTRSLPCLCRARFSSFSDEESSNQTDDLTRRLSNDFASISGEESFKSEWERATDFPPIFEGKAASRKARMLKMKLQLQERFGGVGDSADCSIKTAFSSMVFIIREIQSYTLQMRRIPLCDDLWSLQVRVQDDMHASFVWLFQKVFSQTPTLMVYLMILLANYSVYSMGCTPAIASPQSPLDAIPMVEFQEREYDQNVFSPRNKSSFPSSAAPGGKSTSVCGGNDDGGGNFLSGLSGTDGEGYFGRSGHQEAMFADTSSMSSSVVSMKEEECDVWEAIVKEASEMQAETRDASLSPEIIENLVTPVTARPEADINYSEYSRTETLYQTGLSQDPSNQLLLTNFAQFLYLVARDNDRAEEYFKKAVAVEPPDAELLNKYATFLWRARNDLWAAEETFLEAISADPTNSFYAANYAHFLWNTGGADTCFPLASMDEDTSHPRKA